MTPNCIMCLVGLALLFLVIVLTTWGIGQYIIRHAPLATEDDEHGFVILDDPDRKN